MGKECCGLNCIKNVLNVFNIVFLFAGVGVLGVAVWTIIDKYQYVTLLTSATYPIIVYFLLGAGSLVIIVAFIGCFSVLKEHRPLLLTYIFLLVFIFLSEAMVGILAYLYEENLQTELEMNLNNTFLTTYRVEEEKTAAVDFLQETFHCCGAVDFADWQYSVWLNSDNNGTLNKVPDSCCKTIMEGCGVRDHPSNIHYAGCLNRMARHMAGHLFILCAVGLGICLLQVFGVVLALKLYLKLKSTYEIEDSEHNAFL